MFSKSFYWWVALVCAGFAGLVFPVSSWLRLGFHPDIMGREFAFGFLFVLLVWWFNLVAYPRFVAYFFPVLASRWSRWWRAFSTFFFAFWAIWLDERIQFLHPDDNLKGYELPEYANEFRAFITAGFVLVIVFFLDITRRFYHARMENERLKTETSIAQFETLKQQVNPHFLFNSLNILKTMVRNQDVHAEEYVVRLAELYRTLLLSNQKEKVSLEEELVVLNNYLFLLKVRFEDKLLITNLLKPNGQPSFLPPLTLQMLVENCIKHNVVSAEKPLRVEILMEAGSIVVRNNLQPKRSADGSNRIGLDNINRRYMALSGRNIEIEKTDGYFTVRLPLI